MRHLLHHVCAHRRALTVTAAATLAAVVSVVTALTPAAVLPAAARPGTRAASAVAAPLASIASSAREATSPVGSAGGTRLIVGYRPAAGAALSARSAAHATDASVVSAKPDHGYSVVEVGAGADATAAAAALRAAPGVRYVEPDGVNHKDGLPDDPLYDQQWGLQRIGMPVSWDFYGRGSRNVEIAILDTGLYDHPDLGGPQGRIDWANAWDYGDNDPDVSDDDGHGTHVTGIAAESTDNDIYGAGVAGNCTILPLKVFAWHDGQYTALDSDLADAIYDVIALSKSTGRRFVINMSLGGADWTQTMQDATAAARANGVFIAASAGNEGSWLASYYPAAYPGVTAVGAVDDSDKLVTVAEYGWGSNTGPWLDLVAPGTGIVSTTMEPPYYAAWGGTSMATPFATGAAALLLARNGALNAAQIEKRLEATAFDLGAGGRDDEFGYGRLDAGYALDARDRFDPDASVHTAKRLSSTGAPSRHVLSPVGETDWQYADVTPLALYRARTTGLFDGADTVLDVYTPLVRRIGGNDDDEATPQGSTVWFRAPASGRVFTRVWDQWRQGGGYELSLTRMPDDPYEYDDLRPYAKWHAVGATYSHKLAPAGDADWIRYQVRRDLTYTFTAVGAGESEPMLELRGADGNLMAAIGSRGVPANRGGTLTWKARYTGFVLVRVWDRFGVDGAYTLRATAR